MKASKVRVGPVFFANQTHVFKYDSDVRVGHWDPPLAIAVKNNLQVLALIANPVHYLPYVVVLLGDPNVV